MSAANKINRVSSAFNAADIITGSIVEMIEKVFHIEDLFTLAKGNSFVGLNFFGLICNLDYVIFTPLDANPVGNSDTGIIGAAETIIGVGGKNFKCTPAGKVAAVAECFRIAAAKMDQMVSIDTLTAFMQGTGAAQIAQDAVNSYLKGGNSGAPGVGSAITSLAKLAPAVAAL